MWPQMGYVWVPLNNYLITKYQVCLVARYRKLPLRRFKVLRRSGKCAELSTQELTYVALRSSRVCCRIIQAWVLVQDFLHEFDEGSVL